MDAKLNIVYRFLHLRLSSGDYELLKELANAQGRTVSGLVKFLIAAYIKQLPTSTSN